MVDAPPLADAPTGAPGSRDAVVIRPIHPSDRDALERFYADLSEESRLRRFLGVTRGVSHDQSGAFCAPDHDHREGFVATVASSSSGDTIVGHLCLEPISAADAEVAIAVADAYQHRGIGRRLLTAGIAWAERAGFRALVATTFPWNTRIHGLLRTTGRPAEIRMTDDLSIVTIRLGRALPAAA
jgi:acetyltransferase